MTETRGGDSCWGPPQLFFFWEGRGWAGPERGGKGTHLRVGGSALDTGASEAGDHHATGLGPGEVRGSESQGFSEGATREQEVMKLGLSHECEVYRGGEDVEDRVAGLMEGSVVAGGQAGKLNLCK